MINKDSPLNTYLAAAALNIQGFHEESVLLFKNAINKNNKNNSFWWARLAKSYSSSISNKKIRVEPLTGYIPRDAKDINLIEKAYMKAIKIKPSPHYWIELSDEFFEAKEWDKAILAIEKAFVINQPDFKGFADVFNSPIFKTRSQHTIFQMIGI